MTQLSANIVLVTQVLGVVWAWMMIMAAPRTCIEQASAYLLERTTGRLNLLANHLAPGAGEAAVATETRRILKRPSKYIHFKRLNYMTYRVHVFNAITCILEAFSFFVLSEI